MPVIKTDGSPEGVEPGMAVVPSKKKKAKKVKKSKKNS
jgi:hypothetical protein